MNWSTKHQNATWDSAVGFQFTTTDCKKTVSSKESWSYQVVIILLMMFGLFIEAENTVHPITLHHTFPNCESDF